jgi:hypothetical protein
MTVIPTSAVIRDCAVNSRYKFLIGFYMGNQVHTLSVDALLSKSATDTREKLAVTGKSHWGKFYFSRLTAMSSLPKTFHYTPELRNLKLVFN